VVSVRIVHVITRGDVGGAQTHVVELASAQRSMGDDVIALAGTDGTAMDRCREAGVDVTILPSLGVSRTRLWQRPALDDLRDRLSELRPDIVHAHSSNGGFLARLACRRLGVPCVYTAHGWPFQSGAALSQRILSFGGELIAGRIGDATICLTDAEAEIARRARVARRGRLWVIPNGLADVPSSFRCKHRSGAPSIAMVARFAPPKRQRELIDALAGLIHREWTLTLVGDGPELAACREHGEALLGDRVSFLGHRDDVPRLLADHDVLVLWSGYEGMPISLLEGMRAGMCCVSSDLPGVRALFGSPPSGIVAGSTTELRVALDAVLGDPDHRAMLAAAARARYESGFSAAAMQRAVADVYADVIQRHR
jgi:glycosyltransferase involved in cell wall biosynthesis